MGLRATMELEQARLEQRRLELLMLLSQRRIHQEIEDLQSQVAHLADLTSPTSGSGPLSGSQRYGRGSGASSSSTDHRRQAQEQRGHATAAFPQEMQVDAFRRMAPRTLVSSPLAQHRARLSLDGSGPTGLTPQRRFILPTERTELGNDGSASPQRSNAGEARLLDNRRQSGQQPGVTHQHSWHSPSNASFVISHGLTQAENLRRSRTAGTQANTAGASPLSSAAATLSLRRPSGSSGVTRSGRPRGGTRS